MHKLAWFFDVEYSSSCLTKTILFCEGFEGAKTAVDNASHASCSLSQPMMAMWCRDGVVELFF